MYACDEVQNAVVLCKIYLICKEENIFGKTEDIVMKTEQVLYWQGYFYYWWVLPPSCAKLFLIFRHGY